MRRAEDVVGQLGGHYMGQVTRTAHQIVMLCRCHPQRATADISPKLFDARDRVRRRPRRWRDHADSIDEQIGPRGARTHLLCASHRVTSDEMPAGLGYQRLQFLDDVCLDAADIRNGCAAFERRQHLLQDFPHLSQRGA